MCDEPRVFSTSFRYSGLVQNVLDNAKGKTIADKIENICLDYEENKVKREKHIKDLDKQIADKKRQLELLADKIWQLKNVSSDLEDLVKSIRECNTNN